MTLLLSDSQPELSIKLRDDLFSFLKTSLTVEKCFSDKCFRLCKLSGNLIACLYFDICHVLLNLLQDNNSVDSSLSLIDPHLTAEACKFH